MRITIIRNDNTIGIDGVFLNVDLSSLQLNLRIVQWNGSTGHEEWIDQPNTAIANVVAYESVLAKWQEAKAVVDAKALDPYFGMTEQEKALAIALVNRASDIEASQTSEGLKEYTIKQAQDWITNTLTNAPNTTIGVKQAVGQILLKMVPYILPK